MASEEATSICNHCERSVPFANIDLHFAHCSRNLERCKVCGDMVPKKHAEEHYLSTHSLVACSLCSETMERENLDIHKGKDCPRRIVTCEYLSHVDDISRREVCGNRTKYCSLCKMYVRLRNRIVHETTCTGVSGGSAGSSRETRFPEPERPARPERRAAPLGNGRRKQLFWTIALTGIAVILGSFFFQKKVDTTIK